MRSKTKKRIERPMLITFSLGIVLLLLFSAFLFTEANREKEMRINLVTHDYIEFQNQIENFLTSNINLMTGFSAYIQTFEQYDDKENLYLSRESYEGQQRLYQERRNHSGYNDKMELPNGGEQKRAGCGSF